MFPFTISNIPASSEYGVYISQLMHYSRACYQYSDFLNRAQLLTLKLPQQGYVAPRLKSSLQNFYGRHHNLVSRYSIANVSFTFKVDVLFPISLSMLLPHMTVYMSNTVCVL